MLSAIAQSRPQPLLVLFLDLIAFEHQKEAAVGCAHPTTVDTVQRCALLFFFEATATNLLIANVSLGVD